MKCAEVQQNIALAAYGELPDDQYHALEQHLAVCRNCQEEFAAVTALQQAMALAPIEEPSANLLARGMDLLPTPEGGPPPNDPAPNSRQLMTSAFTDHLRQFAKLPGTIRYTACARWII